MLAALLIGLFTGLRSLAPAAVVAWSAHAGWLLLDGPLAWIGSTASVAVLTLLAVGELVADKLPNTPSRTAPPGLVARLVMGALCGACITAAAGQGAAMGAIAGAVGGLAGCFGGYRARVGLRSALGVPDVVVALAEDAVAIAGALLVVLWL
jgi:uncharacterized membrane protein